MKNIYHAIVDNIQEAVLVTKEGIICYTNPQMRSLLQCKKEQIIGKYFEDIINKKEDTKTKEKLHNATDNKHALCYECYVKKICGKSFYGRIYVRKVKSKNKDINIISIKNLEIDNKINKVFKQQEQRFYAIIDNTPDIIARFDEDFRYVYINPAGEKLFGISCKDFFWKNDEELNIQGERTKLFHEAIEFVFDEKRTKEFYSEEVINDERKYFYTIMIPEFFADGSVCSALSITRDITQIKEIDQIKSEFISITTHQLRSPLSAINWCSQSLLHEELGKINEEQREYLHNIYSSTAKLIKIADVFLHATIIDLEMFVFNFKELDVVDFARNITKEFTELIREKDIIIAEDYKCSPTLKIDSRVFSIVLRGLLSNAIEYNNYGGNIDLTIKCASQNKVIIKIGDSGCGIPKQSQQKIFTKFYRAEEARNMKAYGTGLDLYIMKSLLEKMGGSIEVESPNSKFGKGSLFTVIIPFTEKLISCKNC